MTKHDKTKLNPYFIKHSIYSIADVKALHKGHFFSPDTMRFFSSRVNEAIYPTLNKVYFITTERRSLTDERRVATIRSLDLETGSISTECYQVGGLAKAKGVALKLALAEIEVQS